MEYRQYADTRYRLASLTKQFTSALIMQLVEQGKIRLDDPIGKYYAEAPASWRAVTIHRYPAVFGR
jgi:CubicO group peptidase (beta-lactamase class C family)